MKTRTLLLFLSLIACGSKLSAQSKDELALKQILAMPADTHRVGSYWHLIQTSAYLWENKRELVLSTTEDMKRSAEKLNDDKHLYILYFFLLHYYEDNGQYDKSYENVVKVLDLAKKKRDLKNQLHAYEHLITCYNFMQEYDRSLAADRQALLVANKLDHGKEGKNTAEVLTSIAAIYAEQLKDYDKALRYDQRAVAIVKNSHDDNDRASAIYQAASDALKAKRYTESYNYYLLFEKIPHLPAGKMYGVIANVMGELCRAAPDTLLRRMGIAPANRLKRAAYYIDSALRFGQSVRYLPYITDRLKERSEIYALQGNYQQAYRTHLQYLIDRDSVQNEATKTGVMRQQFVSEFNKRTDSLRFREQLTQARLHVKQMQSYYFIAGIILLLALSGFIWRNYRKLNYALSNLKAAQQQLVQSEKMASLGELTAGIAHEIQNPLNFVNNFSEVSEELIMEAEEEVHKGDTEETLVILSDLKQNLQKIHHHGRRADGIVKGMLEHSRISTGQKEPTDLNKLADEYLRLAYHGLRAKDKSFNAELTTDFDHALPAVLVVPQEIGRVLLNIYNNAFYAVHQRQQLNEAHYRPEVTVQTVRIMGAAIIRITDNGSGIPESIKSKIMQPFFTTKPTGQGTGLGLSLSYDIIVNGHLGQLTADSNEKQGTTFEIRLPVE